VAGYQTSSGIYAHEILIEFDKKWMFVYCFSCFADHRKLSPVIVIAILIIFTDTARTVCGAGSMKLSDVRLSLCPILRRSHGMRRVCCCGPGRQAGKIDRLLHGAPAATRRLAADASSVMFTAT